MYIVCDIPLQLRHELQSTQCKSNDFLPLSYPTVSSQVCYHFFHITVKQTWCEGLSHGEFTLVLPIVYSDSQSRLTFVYVSRYLFTEALVNAKEKTLTCA